MHALLHIVSLCTVVAPYEVWPPGAYMSVAASCRRFRLSNDVLWQGSQRMAMCIEMCQLSRPLRVGMLY